MATIRAGYLAVALKIQEAADLSANDVRTRLADALNDQYRGTGKWAYFVDHFGDGESGDVIYSCDQDTMKASYEISGGDASAAKCVIDFEGAQDVVPRTVYEPEEDEDTHYAAMQESFVGNKLYTELPLYERFIAKSERDSAGSSDFAGKGKSFPILKPEDVQAAVHAMGRAGSDNAGPSAIKAKIISIAKRKGWTKQLPKAWQGDEVKEAAGASKTNSSTDVRSPTSTSTSTKAYTAGNITVTGGAGAGDTSVTITLKGTGIVPQDDGGVNAMESQPHVITREAGKRNSGKDLAILQAIHDHAASLGATCGGTDSHESAHGAQSPNLKLVESVPFLVDIPLREAFTVGTKIKLIAPGKGSSAWYTEAALKQAAADKIFHAGLPMRIDHPTAAEEAARPEGSVKDWGAVLANDAEWLESYVGKDGKDLGKGLYSAIKPFSDHAQTIQEKGPYAGVSIAANGNAVLEAGRPLIRDGVPVLAKFISAEGADMVTRAGAGGMFLSEAAKAAKEDAPVKCPACKGSGDCPKCDGKEKIDGKDCAKCDGTGDCPKCDGDGKLTEAARAANLNTGGATDMDAAELKTLKESLAAQAETNRKLLERAIRGDAREEATKILAAVSLHEAAKQLVIDTAMKDIPQKDGGLDTAKFTEAVNAEAKRVGAAFAAAGTGARPVGMGAAPVQIDAKEAERRVAQAKDDAEDAIKVFESLGLPRNAAEFAAKGRAA